MKPILFNADMVRAILDNHKTVTRRAVRPRYCDSVFEMFRGELCEASSDKPPRDNGDGTTTRFVRTYVPCKAPYRPGDILYVRETWCWCPCWDCGMDLEGECCDDTADKFYHPQKLEWGCYGYKASFAECEFPFGDGWRPSIHMPREAARIFLRVTNVYPQQLKDVTEADARAEGFNSRDEFMSAILKMYPDCTEDSWFWANKFERISREEALA